MCPHLGAKTLLLSENLSQLSIYRDISREIARRGRPYNQICFDFVSVPDVIRIASSRHSVT